MYSHEASADGDEEAGPHSEGQRDLEVGGAPRRGDYATQRTSHLSPATGDTGSSVMLLVEGEGSSSQRRGIDNLYYLYQDDYGRDPPMTPFEEEDVPSSSESSQSLVSYIIC